MKPPERASLSLRAPRFVAYLVAQFLGALNDNAFRAGVLLFALGASPDETRRVVFASLASSLFALPWLLFSGLAGALADRFRKDRVLFWTKLPEAFVLLLGVAGFEAESLALLLVTLFLLSTHSAFFGPAKYGILPELFSDDDLVAANGLVSTTTNAAILLGTALGGVLEAMRASFGNVGWSYVALAVAGTGCAWLVPRASAGSRVERIEWSPWNQFGVGWRLLRTEPVLRSSVVGLMFFTFLGALLLTLLPVYCATVLDLGSGGAALLLTGLVVGVALGSLGAGWLSRGRVESGLVPLGALVLTLACVDLSLLSPATLGRVLGVPLRPLVDLAVLGFGGGLFSVPIQALLQRESPTAWTGRLIAFSNVASNLMLLLAAAGPAAVAMLAGAGALGRGASALLMPAALASSVAVLAYVALRMPDSVTRLLLLGIVSLRWRLTVRGAGGLPRGAALLVAQPGGPLDPGIVTTASGRMVRSLTGESAARGRTAGRWLGRRHEIPRGHGDAGLRAACAQARDGLRAGRTVCLFPDAGIAPERLMADLAVPVLSVSANALPRSRFLRPILAVDFGAPPHCAAPKPS